MQLDADARDVLVSNPELVDAVVRTPRRIFLLATRSARPTPSSSTPRASRSWRSISASKRTWCDLAALMKSRHAQFRHPGAGAERQCRADRLGGERAGSRARRRIWRPASPAIAKKVVNMLSIAGGQQVMLKVRVAEMDRNIAKQFGVNLAGAAIVARRADRRLDLAISSAWSAGAQRSVRRPGRPGLSSAPAHSTATLWPTLPGRRHCIVPNNVQGTLKALEQVGLVHMLAEPNLTAVSRRNREVPRRRRIPGAGSAATATATSRSSSSSSASASPSRRWCWRRAASRCSSPPKSAN